MTAVLPLHSRLSVCRSSITAAVLRDLAERFGPVMDRDIVLNAVEPAVTWATDLLRGRYELPAGLLDGIRAVGVAAARRRRLPDEVACYAGSLVVATQAELGRRAEPGDHLELAALRPRIASAASVWQEVLDTAYLQQLRRDRFARVASDALASALRTGSATTEVLVAAGYSPGSTLHVVAINAEAGARADIELGVADALARIDRAMQCDVQGDIVVLKPAVADGPHGAPDLALLLKGDPRLAPAAMAAETAVGLDAVAAAVRAARLLARTAARLGRVGRVTTRADMLLEDRLLDREAMCARLRDLVGSVAEEPELVRTLRVLYLNDLNRISTAQELGIARRTLAYRLQRVRELTGMSPVSTRGVLVLGLGVAALSTG